MNVYQFPKQAKFHKSAIESGVRLEFERALVRLESILEPYEVYNLITSHARRVKKIQVCVTSDGVGK